MYRIKKDNKWYFVHITNIQTFEYELIEDKNYVEPTETIVKHVFDYDIDFGSSSEITTKKTSKYDLGGLE